MSHRQVTDLIGQEKDAASYSTGKHWIPFYFGSDYVNTALYYEGEGRIVMDSDEKVVAIEYDPKEDGYK
jgi:hypothetical protein